MGRLSAALYGSAVYVVFLAAFLYAIGFVGNLPVPKTIDSGTPGPWLMAVLVNAALLAVFAIQHSVMARPAFKRWWTRIVPKRVERSTYVLFASLALILIYAFWQPMPAVVWHVNDPVGTLILHSVFVLGWVVVLVSTFLLNHFELFGLRQVFASSEQGNEPHQFRTPMFYRYVRHPIYLGFLLAFWAAPTMSVGHLMFAVGTTGYILLGIWLEERDLISTFGDRYRQYRTQVGMLLPRFGKRRGVSSVT